ncbi:MAG: 16S rRNA (cytidine(1402)-2'-O)-methyltransferase [Proteobacteria bacterium]|nr:16S rRNA (cytidine(1402)-2'-O)-methyltransferase [Pseudomonadota bacterium]
MGTLHLVATPIGNLEDITLRALRVLAEADLLLAEDTRRTRILLEHHDVAAEMRSLHAHNEAARTEEALAVLGRDGRVALVSDAGTPLVSDPGERLAAAAAAAGHRVESVPGPSAVLAALACSGLPATPFVFLGFLPRKASDRRALWTSFRERPETLVCFESPRRLPATLVELAKEWGPRDACVARELTKLHEQVARGTLEELAAAFSGEVRGEVTLVIAGADPTSLEPWDEPRLDAAIAQALAEGGRPAQVAADLARLSGRPREELYARVVAARERS